LETTTTEAAHAVEQLVHQSLATDRHNRAREFFTTSLPVAIDTIERIAYQHGAIANDLTVIARLLEEELAEQQQAQREAAAAAAERAQREAAAASERTRIEAAAAAERKADYQAYAKDLEEFRDERAQREATASVLIPLLIAVMFAGLFFVF
jgi:septal ring factor EnvC (AmiA/AmiB activator)